MIRRRDLTGVSSSIAITGIDTVTVAGNFDWPLVRIDTDGGIVGYGEVRDHSRGHVHSEAYYVDDPAALARDLEPELVGADPTNMISRFEDLREFGGWGRLGGGVSAVETALFDIAGKYYDAPAHQLLGGRYRDEVRIYCDCRAGNPVADSAIDYGLEANDYAPAAYADHAARREAQGFDFLKFDLDPNALEHVTGDAGVRGGRLTEAGLDYLEDVVDAIRGAISPATDLGFDCASMRDLSTTDAIRLGRVLDDYGVAAYEDVTHDRDVAGWEEITGAIDTPTITGEDLYTLDGFRELIRREAVDMVGPDLLTAGGIRETTRIGDVANQHGMPANLHFAASPIGFMATVHAAAAIPNLVAAEFHAIGVPWWNDLVEETGLISDGSAPVPDRPGLGITPDEDEIRARAVDGASTFD